MKAVMNELEKMMISFFFIDEIHTIIVGAGGTTGSLDASICSNRLCRGDQCGATTLDEYRQYIEKMVL
jgi:ATP-dependent Clp protease ATP-binding subunit ClpA